MRVAVLTRTTMSLDDKLSPYFNQRCLFYNCLCGIHQTTNVTLSAACKSWDCLNLLGERLSASRTSFVCACLCVRNNSNRWQHIASTYEQVPKSQSSFEYIQPFEPVYIYLGGGNARLRGRSRFWNVFCFQMFTEHFQQKSQMLQKQVQPI